MIRYMFAVVFVVLMAVAYAAYANGQSDEPAPQQPQEMVTVTTTSPVSASQPIPIVVGQTSKFAITLESNKTTGYSWRLGKPLDAKVLKNTGSVYSEPKSDLVGVPGSESWTFHPVNKGTTTIVMEYARPWEKDTKPAKTQTFSVTVK